MALLREENYYLGIKISLEWLNDFIDLKNINAEQICQILTSCGLECMLKKIYISLNIKAVYQKRKQKYCAFIF